jgi:hypothetical protein
MLVVGRMLVAVDDLLVLLVLDLVAGWAADVLD